MPKTVKSVAKHYTYNTTYTLNPRRLESIINVLEKSKDHLNRDGSVNLNNSYK